MYFDFNRNKYVQSTKWEFYTINSANVENFRMGVGYRDRVGISLQWRHNERDGVSNHQPNDCSLNRLFRRNSKETSKLRVTGLCAVNSPVTG